MLTYIIHANIIQTGELQTNSALNLIVFGTKLEHLDLIEYVVVDLLNAKYNTFVKRVFRRQMVVFLLFFLLSSFCFISRPNQVVYVLDPPTNQSADIFSSHLLL
jgi:hypothetical protein